MRSILSIATTHLAQGAALFLVLAMCLPGCNGGSSGGGGGGGGNGGGPGKCKETDWTSVGDDQSNAWFGYSVASAGDVNGDGYEDAIVGAPWFRTSNNAAGKAYLYLGGPAGLSTSPSWISSGDDQPSDWFGHSVASAGDVNADGYDDVIVGAPNHDTVPIGGPPGKAFVYLGGPAGLSGTPVWTSSGDAQMAKRFGFSVASAGDVNYDGFDDVIVGAPEFDTAGADVGQAYVYFGEPWGISTSPAWTSIGEDADKARFGWSVASAGDVNGDGHADVIVGAPVFFTVTASGVGRAYVFLGRSSGPQTTPVWESSGDEKLDARFGYSVASAGDVNGDGYGDIIVGAPEYSLTMTDVGKAYVYFGGPSVISANPVWTSTGDDQALAFFGGSVASAGDVNGDGYSDVVVSAWMFDTANNHAGKGYVHLGGPLGPSPIPNWTSVGEDEAEGYFGARVASVGDVNGDGYTGVIIGARRGDAANASAGKAYVFTCIGP